LNPDQSQLDAAEVVAAHLARTTFSDLPGGVAAAVKASILDNLGCILAGTASAEVAAVRSLAFRWGGEPTSTVIGSGGRRLPPIAAVLANGAAIHQYDFDDVHDAVTCHPTASTLVPALAVAEERGGVSGRDLILAVALGSDLTSRVSKAIKGAHGHPWYRAPVVGVFGATAAAAKILGATERQHLEALGLALPQIGGTYASLHHHGSSVRSIRDGVAYRNGVLATELALAGLHGDPEVFEGKYGFYQAYYNGNYSRESLLAGLGSEYEAARVSLKPWPSARHLHTTLTAVLDILHRHALSLEQVAEVIVDVGRVNRERCQPIQGGDSQHIDLLSNLPYAVAAAIRYGNVPLEAYLRPDLIDDVIATAMPKVHWRYNPEQDGEWRFEPGRVQIRSVAGEIFSATCKTALGHPDNPMTEVQRHAKFRLCARLAARPLADAQASQVIEIVEDLERCERIEALMELIA
jgi:2-methylcitrate dehydratase PrpD